MGGRLVVDRDLGKAYDSNRHLLGRTIGSREGRSVRTLREHQPWLKSFCLMIPILAGIHTRLFRSEPDLTKLSTGLGGLGAPALSNWNDRVSSFVILSGVWEFIVDVDFVNQQGGTAGHGPGLYDDVRKIGISNDAVSSIGLLHA